MGEVIGIGEIGVEVSRSRENSGEVLQSYKPRCSRGFYHCKGCQINTIKTSAECGVNLVVGTTGFSDEQMTEIVSSIEENDIRAIIAPNMAVGVKCFL